MNSQAKIIKPKLVGIFLDRINSGKKYAHAT
jgi:hypothetical protein